MADPVGSVFVEFAASTATFFADVGKVSKHLGAVSKDAGRFSEQFMKAGQVAAKGIAIVAAATTAASAAVLAITKSYAASGDELAKLATKTGESAETLSVMRAQAKLAGVEVVQLTTGYRQLALNAFQAAKGSAQQRDLFDMLGVSVKDANGALRPTGDLMMDVADRLQSMTNATERAAVAQRILGDSGVAMLPLLVQGSAAIRAQAVEAEQLSLVWSTKAAKAAEQFNDNLTRLGMVVEGVRNILGSAFLPIMNDLVEQFLNWHKANNQLIKQRLHDWATRIAQALADTARAAIDIVQALHEMGAGDVILRVFRSISTAVLFVGKALRETGVELDVFRAKIGANQEDVARLNRELREYRRIQDELFKRRVEGLFDAPPPMAIPESPAAAATPGTNSMSQRLEGLKLERQALGELFFMRERMENQLDRGSLDTPFDPKRGNAQLLATQRLMELMPELTAQEAHLLALHNERSALNVVGQEQQRQAEIAETITHLQQQTQLEEASFALQSAFYQSAPGLFGQADAARQAGLRLFEQQEETRMAVLDEQLRQGTLSWEHYHNEILKLDMETQAKRLQLVSQYPTFWEQQLQSIVSANAFSMGAIVSTWTSGISQVILKGGDLRQAWESTQQMILQSALNTLVQWVAQAALAYAKDQGLHTALTAAKTALFGAETKAKAASVVVTSKLETAGAASSLANLAAVGAAAVVMGAVIVAQTAAIFAAIAAALTATVIGSPLGAAFAAAAGAVSLAGGAAVTAAGVGISAAVSGGAKAVAGMGAIPMAQGGSGLVTQPTLFLAGEAGPERFAFQPVGRGSERAFSQTIILELDGRQILESHLDNFIGMLRLRGATI